MHETQTHKQTYSAGKLQLGCMKHTNLLCRQIAARMHETQTHKKTYSAGKLQLGCMKHTNLLCRQCMAIMNCIAFSTCAKRGRCVSHLRAPCIDRQTAESLALTTMEQQKKLHGVISPSSLKPGPQPGRSASTAPRPSPARQCSGSVPRTSWFPRRTTPRCPPALQGPAA